MKLPDVREYFAVKGMRGQARAFAADVLRALPVHSTGEGDGVVSVGNITHFIRQLEAADG